jgi:glucose-1-phosphate cytidylyltransferase
MKAVILAGGLGTGLSEETTVRPKPMVEIGGKPILWHIMKIYSAQEINDFVICCGYNSYMIKEYFANYLLHMSDVTFDIKRNKIEIHQSRAEPWRVWLVGTGDGTGTGGRIKRIKSYLDDETFCLAYGDGLSDIDIKKLLEFHHQQRTLATLTAVQPPGRYGAFSLTNDQQKIAHFRKKPKGDSAWVNGGIFVLEPGIMNYIDDDATFWEAGPLSRLAEDDELAAYRHYRY